MPSKHLCSTHRLLWCFENANFQDDLSSLFKGGVLTGTNFKDLCTSYFHQVPPMYLRAYLDSLDDGDVDKCARYTNCPDRK